MPSSTTLKADEATLRQTIATVERRLESVPYRQNEFALLSRDHQATREQYESLLKRYEEAQLGAEHGNRKPGRTLPDSGSRRSAVGAERAEPPPPADHGPLPGRAGRRRGGAARRAVRHLVPQRRRPPAVHEACRCWWRFPASSVRAAATLAAQSRSSPPRCSSGSCSWGRSRRTWHGTTSRWCACWFEADNGHADGEPTMPSTHIDRPPRQPGGAGILRRRAVSGLRLKIERLQQTRGVRVLAVTSPGVSDGKTVTSINLAGALARGSARASCSSTPICAARVEAHLGLHARGRAGLAEALRRRTRSGCGRRRAPAQSCRTVSVVLAGSSRARRCTNCSARPDSRASSRRPAVSTTSSCSILRRSCPCVTRRVRVPTGRRHAHRRGGPRDAEEAARRGAEPARRVEVLGIVFNGDDSTPSGRYDAYYKS